MKDQRMIYIALAALGGFMGLAVSLSKPITGFFITGMTITLALIGLMIDFKEQVSDKLPSFGNRTLGENKVSVIVGVLTLAAFIPFLFPEVLLAIALLLLLVAGLTYYLIKQGGTSTGLKVEDSAKFFLVATAFFVASQLKSLLIFSPAFMFAWFLYTLLPEKTQANIMKEVNLE